MEAQTTPRYSFTPISAAPDWLTATQGRGSAGRAFRDAAQAILDTERAAAREVKAAALRDYRGWRGDHFFTGERAGERIIIVTGPACPTNFETVAQAARNVSRLDLQVTVWTHGEQPHLGQEGLATLDRSPNTKGRPRSYGMHLRRPHGETLEINSRASDNFARLYDWASAHKAGEPRTLWRYEVELKRRVAARAARAAISSTCRESFISGYVHHWFEARGLTPEYIAADSQHSVEIELVEPRRDVLDWLERSISKTIAREVKRHGLPRVLTALGLAHRVVPIPEEGDTHATESARPVSHHRKR